MVKIIFNLKKSTKTIYSELPVCIDPLSQKIPKTEIIEFERQSFMLSRRVHSLCNRASAKHWVSRLQTHRCHTRMKWLFIVILVDISHNIILYMHNWQFVLQINSGANYFNFYLLMRWLIFFCFYCSAHRPPIATKFRSTKSSPTSARPNANRTKRAPASSSSTSTKCVLLSWTERTTVCTVV